MESTNDYESCFENEVIKKFNSNLNCLYLHSALNTKLDTCVNDTDAYDQANDIINNLIEGSGCSKSCTKEYFKAKVEFLTYFNISQDFSLHIFYEDLKGIN